MPRFAAVLILARAVSACQFAPVVNEEDQQAFLELIDAEIDAARSAGADPQQIRLLEESRDAGMVSAETMRSAISYYGDCVEGLGGDFEWGEPTGPADYPMFQYYTSLPLGAEYKMDECLDLHLRSINGVYQSQPAYRAVRAQRLLDHREALVECLRANGREIADDATPDELRREIMYGITGFYIEDAGSGVIDPGFFDCASEVGLEPTDLSI